MTAGPRLGDNDALRARGIDCADIPQSTIVSLLSEAASLVVVFDGAGSWGNGMEAAAWCRDRLAERVTDLDQLSAEGLASVLLALDGDVPEALQDDVVGWSFSATALLVKGAELSVVAAGIFGVSLWGADGVTSLYRPLMLGDHLIATGKLTREQARTFPHRDIVLGPFFGDQPTAEGLVVTPVSAQLGPHDVVLLAHLYVHDLLANRGQDWRRAEAHGLQQLASQHELRPSAVVLLRRPQSRP